MAIRVNTIEKVVEWRWWNMFYVALASFFISLLWQHFLTRRAGRPFTLAAGETTNEKSFRRVLAGPQISRLWRALLGLFLLSSPFFFSVYHTNVMTTALVYIVLGLGLNIIVGLTGLLNLGYVAFYAVGAYCYALLNHHFGVGFWTALPLGALAGSLAGLLLALPVIRLRGDYLAIVTLGFGEITRLILENWNEFSFGPSGISHISPPGLFGISLSVKALNVYIYFLMLGFCLATIFVVRRWQNSRIGRAWVAIREDETASQAMGIDTARAKRTAFAIGAGLAGMMGVIFAAKTTFINPASFNFIESAMILSIVVLGGIGSIPGIITAALLLIILPEYLRVFSDYRMLIFGMAMVLMMTFRPQGIIPYVRRTYEFHPQSGPQGNN
ncbi:MAG: branched-chain amino acid ABC transporter permease, partial [Deltaproteobacteria bacterium]|nr:branched-chain amino acid ABC transporter permease [Deltaproteobacteria bacterium]